MRQLRSAALAIALLALAAQPACMHDHAQRDLDERPLTLGDRGDPPTDPGEAVVRGFLRDELTRQPIEGVTVSFRSREPGQDTAMQTAITNAKGRFSVVMPVGLYDVFPERCGYKPQSSQVEARAGYAAQVVLFLAPGGTACR